MASSPPHILRPALTDSKLLWVLPVFSLAENKEIYGGKLNGCLQISSALRPFIIGVGMKYVIYVTVAISVAKRMPCIRWLSELMRSTAHPHLSEKRKRFHALSIK
ncbi:hypothetical protein SUGI_0029710 [Cryptomeria japonica]|nr:hypothetical protein SUGI_0029710 [Cryptomeria japonica]